MHIYIITGTSSGLGEAVAAKIMADDSAVFCISRKKSEKLLVMARKNNYRLKWLECDLSLPGQTTRVIPAVASDPDIQEAESVTLVNNAAVVEPVRRIERCNFREIVDAYQENIISPIILTAAFIGTFGDLDVRKRIINVSSGAADAGYSGLSCYCSSKAALNEFTQCAANEQQAQPYPVEFELFEPGSMDTRMQQRIRMAKEENFPDVIRFRKAKATGMLQQVDEVAEQLLRVLASAKVHRRSFSYK